MHDKINQAPTAGAAGHHAMHHGARRRTDPGTVQHMEYGSPIECHLAQSTPATGGAA